MPIFHLKTFNEKFFSRRKIKGFTLVEILLVMALLALLVVSVAPNIKTINRTGAQSSVRRFGAMVKYAYDQAVLTGRVHRIVLNIDDQIWSVESAEPGVLPIDRMKEPTYSSAPTEEPAFAPTSDKVVEPIPVGTQIVQVESFRLPKEKSPAKEGTVNIYAFPGGFIDESAVYISEIGQEKLQVYKIETKTLTGRVKVSVLESIK
jgi:prepilin-type N-terminal cleavage/methylation domain-containing protein